MTSSQSYLFWQQKLQTNRVYRLFWSFCGIYSVVILFVAGLSLLALGELRIAGLALLAFFLGRFIVSPFIYLLYSKPRPYQILNFIPIHSRLLSLTTIRHNSFPSDHAVSFAAISTVFLYYYPLLGTVCLLFAILNGMGRIVLGYHDMWDVLCGWVVGISCALITVYVFAPLL